ncbi:Aste57867_12971 [Aphanomyces stellatus]|uniref:Aste57867_12971 protein n=1 Tax=Aphanomyces stellatus TaxID=120398 RepID=A0A485KWZ7_9STRA|nr:hypothetical protein As57867_012923 [Aphanomyces stellatus]VFT89817.1 Aste57867_12971 [Aphanomyces stellatus]
MQRRLDVITRLHADVRKGGEHAKDATHRALQIMMATPQPVRLAEPKVMNEAKKLLQAAVLVAPVETEIVRLRLQRLLTEDSRVKEQLRASAHAPPEAIAVARMQRLTKIKSLVDSRAMEAHDAALHAIQILESTPVDALNPPLVQLCQDFIDGIDPSDKRQKHLQHRVMDHQTRGQAPRREEASVPSSPFIKATMTVDSPTLGDTAILTEIFAAFDSSNVNKAFNFLAQITPATWQRTSVPSRAFLLKTAVSHLTSGPLPSPLSARRFLAFIQTLNHTKGLPTHWLSLPQPCAALAKASIQAQDAGPLLAIYTKHLAHNKRSFFRRAVKETSPPPASPAAKAPFPPSNALLAAVVDTLAALHKQAQLPDLLASFPGLFTRETLAAFLRMLALPESAPHAARLVQVMPLQAFVDFQFQGPLLRTMLKCDLVVDALDALLAMHALGHQANQPARRIPSAVQTDVLVELYKLQEYDRFHTAYDELWGHGYHVGLLEFRALSSVVPAPVLQDMLGRNEYLLCLQEAQLHASRKAHRHDRTTVLPPDALDLRAVPSTMSQSMLLMHLQQAKPTQDVIVYVEPTGVAVVEAGLAAHGISCSRRDAQVVVPACAVQEVHRVLMLEDADKFLFSSTTGAAANKRHAT